MDGAAVLDLDFESLAPLATTPQLCVEVVTLFCGTAFGRLCGLRQELLVDADGPDPLDDEGLEPPGVHARLRARLRTLVVQPAAAVVAVAFAAARREHVQHRGIAARTAHETAKQRVRLVACLGAAVPVVAQLPLHGVP